MKKIVLIAFMFVFTFTLAACSDLGLDPNGDPNLIIEEQLSSEESLATLSYLSSGFLSGPELTASSNLQFLSNEEETEIEGELDDVNLYFDRLKSMIDNGVESFGSITEQPSDNELFEFMITFTVNEEVYTIYYNVDVETGEMTGIIVIGDVEYTFEVVDNMREYRFEEQEKNQNQEQENNQNDDELDEEDVDLEDEEELDEDDDQLEESETKMMLIARNGEDTIKIMYKTEVEEDETTTKFDMEQTIGGVTKNIFLKISVEEDEYKIDIEDGEDSFTFKQEVEDEGIEYKLSYSVNGVEGTVRITVSVDENGETVYEYRIQEAGKVRNIEKGRPEVPGARGNQNDDDDDLEEESSEV
jgi:hypothetical protein